MNSCKTGLHKFFFLSGDFHLDSARRICVFSLVCYFPTLLSCPFFAFPGAGYPAYQPTDLLKHKMEGLQKELAGLRQASPKEIKRFPWKPARQTLRFRFA